MYVYIYRHCVTRLTNSYHFFFFPSSSSSSSSAFTLPLLGSLPSSRFNALSVFMISFFSSYFRSLPIRKTLYDFPFSLSISSGAAVFVWPETIVASSTP